MPDNRLLSIKDYEYAFDGVSQNVSFTVTTVFGDVSSGMEVKLV